MSRATASPLPAAEGQDAELIKLCQQHIANARAYEGGPGVQLGDPDPLWDILDASRDAILRTPARTMAGVMAKARVAVQQAEIDCKEDESGWDSSDAGTWSVAVVQDLLRIFGEG